MHKLTGKLKEKFQSHHQHTSTSSPSTGTSNTLQPTAEEIIYRYRKQRGVNLGMISSHLCSY